MENTLVETNSVRKVVLDRLTRDILASGEQALSTQPWSVPGDMESHDAPTLAVGNIWRQVNHLRVLSQYCASLTSMAESNPFLHGHPSTCVKGLEWFNQLNRPLEVVKDPLRKSLTRTLDLYCVTAGAMSKAEAAYSVRAALPCVDRGMTRMLLELNFPNTKEYEVDVCEYMLRDKAKLRPYLEWKAEFPKWRSKGLFYPLAVAARYMPDLHSWCPSEVHGTTIGRALGACVTALRMGKANPAPELQGLSVVWNHDATDTASVLGDTLDRLAVLMRVKSNARLADKTDFSLDAALAGFPKSFGPGPYEAKQRAWCTLKTCIEDAFPPSLLCATTSKSRRSTWGYPRLTLDFDKASSVLRVNEISLKWLNKATHQQKFTEAALRPFDYTPVADRACLASQTSARVQEVLWRAGEIVTAPEMALCMLYPRAALASLETSGDPAWSKYQEFCMDKDKVLEGMAGAAKVPPSPAFADFMRRLEAIMPMTSQILYRVPQRLLMWRLDIPPRVIIFTGAHTDPLPSTNAPKMLVNAKVPERSAGAILTVFDAPVKEESVRMALQSFAGHPTGMSAHASNVISVKVTGDVLCTTLAEAVHSFATTPPVKKTTCPLGASMPWSADSIDERYAERQDGANGFRFRDWVAMHVDASGTHQSRLASHGVEFQTLYTTKIPWLSEDGQVRWVRAACTQPLTNRVIQGRSLRQAVEARYLHDTRMLPVAGDEYTTSRANTEIYTQGDQVVVAYAPMSERPDAERRVELLAFELNPAV